MKTRRTYPLDQSPLFRLKSRSRLAGLLKISPGDLRRMTKDVDSAYSEFEVDKKGGGKRGVENPARSLKVAQARIARILGRIEPPGHLFCPVKGRCYVTNAAQHRGQRVVRCLDVKKYFPSVPSRRVFWFFRAVMGCADDVAATLTSIATYRGHLPTGSPLSPIMAYYANMDVWNDIAAICARNGYRLTVYIDDVTVSGAKVSSAVLWEIKQAIFRGGLRYHKEKTFIDRPAEVTGVIIVGDQLRVPNRQLKKLNGFQKTLRQPMAKSEADKLAGRILGMHGQIAQISKLSAPRAVTILAEDSSGGV